MINVFDKNIFWSGALALMAKDLQEIQRCLVLVPHPDDESLGCAGLIATLVAQGTQVQIILTTDGSRSHPNSRKYPADRLAGIRLDELRQAMDLLGLKNEALKYYQAQDSNMPAKGMPGFAGLADRLAEDLIALNPDLILVPYELDPHCDHRATHQLMLSALEKANIPRPRIWEYPIWLYENAVQEDIPDLQPGETLALDISDYSALKMQCIQMHKSQTTHLIDDDPTGFILLPDVIANFTQGKEYFMERKKINPDNTLDKTYFDALYHTSADPWDFEKSAYEQDKYLATIAAIPEADYTNALEIGCSIGVLTEMLSERCKHLVAMDISKTALERARQRLGKSYKVEFLLGGIPQDFPTGNFDLIIMSEVGYYLSMSDLLLTRQQIVNALLPGGVLILVHWIHFVAEYPLSGDEVHGCFNAIGISHLDAKRTADYRLDVYRKT
ncbi:bifunctional PIG-L family deacetylase/class I SAM-dependent methyltransferase [Pedobacter rhodius]|uniref:Bifunctional PIG-L family deacetylase/class I SAM-dependent methyltransferase n=1 Tax=Pedobacter rhodius TaxID=3004098 RepID=A0ABT4KUD0_9SPHI|nr:bifunctional PIG-L family deacetylase/class I SAM-dependent methyltransferase [Pedobacter sp. SJ11]MCZ4222544.1 bifunctional PIG-L family deacetylase/class I SAM-dependent methyltransferase [Pedobacter sp. SJ11]